MSVSRPYKLGLTGSIGMGKSTTTRMFAEEGVPVWDADAAVHRLYDRGGAGVAPIARIVPGAIADGLVDRGNLKHEIAAKPELLAQIEAVIHPLVAQDRADFINRHLHHPVLVFDIPLLFETSADAVMDGIVVVTAPAEVQKDRVLARPGMTEAHFARILSRQVPDDEKRKRADFLIETHKGLDHARDEVRKILRRLSKEGEEPTNA
ncbi:dephospho-CoA kinase [Amaricoccus macauensis]|uniref:dephospho-CoA kinase n=1 Tax=Amaricoccus macauensis TaxID=57001 RepID=UPI003C7D8E43